MKDHEEPLHELDFVPFFQDIEVEIEPGQAREVTLHDGSRLTLRKLEADYDPSSRMEALRVLDDAARSGEVVTGLLYVDTQRPDFLQSLNLHDTPLALLPEAKVRPPESALAEIMEELR
jgi:2-oxoglutarate ferredoxin oxidoreductase subunit beta